MDTDLGQGEKSNLPGFEGAEKLLEIWFKPGPGPKCEKPGLFQVSRDDWVAMLKLVRCEIIGFTSNGELDSYLLSESSMFVSPYRLVLKTCGTTTLLLCLEKLIQISQSVGLSVVDQFFYSRKSFMFPEYQKFPHTNWDDEVKFIEKKFSGGSAYVVGKTNGDHWYCYLWEEGRSQEVKSEMGTDTDYTLEVLMNELDPDSAALHFTKKTAFDPDGKAIVTKQLAALYEGIKIDDFMFDPCGYSCNALMAKGHHYFDVHVTPENHCSYASFETNIPPNKEQNYVQLVSKVVAIFKPKKFTVILFAEKAEFEDETLTPFPSQLVAENARYKRQDRIIYEFEHYDLAFYHYST
jgi:S-adenosylmethionine decarboxylase